ncbi:hypothetical protein R1flu_020627 [Riccia fluitans]|uniref:Uncharacterized protein n=1 Tax=Riccia fluitans TaxID=41844 RepID=A0ABD1ZM21_9MARC
MSSKAKTDDFTLLTTTSSTSSSKRRGSNPLESPPPAPGPDTPGNSNRLVKRPPSDPHTFLQAPYLSLSPLYNKTAALVNGPRTSCQSHDFFLFAGSSPCSPSALQNVDGEDRKWRGSRGEGRGRWVGCTESMRGGRKYNVCEVEIHCRGFPGDIAGVGGRGGLLVRDPHWAFGPREVGRPGGWAGVRVEAAGPGAVTSNEIRHPSPMEQVKGPTAKWVNEARGKSSGSCGQSGSKAAELTLVAAALKCASLPHLGPDFSRPLYQGRNNNKLDAVVM